MGSSENIFLPQHLREEWNWNTNYIINRLKYFLWVSVCVKCATYLIFIHIRNIQNHNSFIYEKTGLQKNIILQSLDGVLYSCINFIILSVGAGEGHFRWKPAEVCMSVYDQIHKEIHEIILINFYSSSPNFCWKKNEMRFRVDRTILYLSNYVGNPATGNQLGAVLLILF